MKKQGLEARIDRFLRRAEKEDINLHGFILNVGGRQKVSAYYAPFREGQPHRMYSVSKTMVACAVGMLMEEGKLRLEDHIVDFFPELLPENPAPFLLRLTLRDMLRMATCYRATAYREYVDQDWTRPFFTGHPDHEPGTVFNYDTGNSQVLASLVKRITGREVIDFLEERLFRPLGCEDARYWLRDPSGQCTGGTGLCMSLRDLNRVALCLSRGGDGLIPAWFVAEMQKKQIDTALQGIAEEEKYGYGWQCWRTRAGWAMYGMGGQLAIICPEKDTALCTIADVRLDPCGIQRIYNAFFEEIYPFVDCEDMEPVSLQLPAITLKNHPSARPAEEGSYLFYENDMEWRSLKFSSNCLQYENAKGICQLPFRPGETIPAEYPGWPGEPATVSAAWISDGNLRIRCHAIGDFPCGFDLLLCFVGDVVTVQSKRSNDPRTNGYAGIASGWKESV